MTTYKFNGFYWVSVVHHEKFITGIDTEAAVGSVHAVDDTRGE